jgi:hypothetical protein
MPVTKTSPSTERSHHPASRAQVSGHSRGARHPSDREREARATSDHENETLTASVIVAIESKLLSADPNMILVLDANDAPAYTDDPCVAELVRDDMRRRNHLGGGPGCRRSSGAPATSPEHAQPPRKSVIGCGNAGSRSIRSSTHMRPSWRTPSSRSPPSTRLQSARPRTRARRRVLPPAPKAPRQRRRTP